MKNTTFLFKLSAMALSFAPLMAHAEQTQTLEKIEVQEKRLPSLSEQTGSYIAPVIHRSATGLPLSEKETPQSTVMTTRQKMDDQKTATLVDTLKQTNGLTVQAVDRGRSSIYSRGFAVDRYQVDGSNIVFDNQWIAGEQLNNTALYDRIEVVRGATGLTTGSGDPSARVNLIRKHATSKTRQTVLEGGLSMPFGYQATIDHSQPITQDGSVRSRFVLSHGDNKTTFEREKVGQTTLYGVLDADLSDKTQLSVGAKHGINRQKALLWGGLPAVDADGNKIDWSPKTNSAPAWSYWDSKSTEFFSHLKHKFSQDWQAELSANHTENSSDSQLFYATGIPDTAGNMTGVWPGKFKVKSTQDALGFTLNGAYDLFGRKHRVVGGLNYNRSRFKAWAADGTQSQANTSIHDFNAYPEPKWGAMNEKYFSDAQEWGAFAATQINATDRLGLVLGSRFANAKRDRLFYGTASQYRSGNTWLPYAGATFILNDNHSVYASYTDIFKPQDRQDVNGGFLDPIRGKNYEIGLKSSYLNDKLNSQISLFQIQQDNLAVLNGKQLNNPLLDAYRAEKGTKSKGFELDLAGQITPEWNVSAGYSYVRAKDRLGKDLNTNMPKQSAKFFTTYDLSRYVKGLTVGGGVQWQGKSVATISNRPVTRKAYAVMDLMARYQVNPQLEMQLNVNNVWNKRPYNMFGNFNQINYLDGRTVKASVQYRF